MKSGGILSDVNNSLNSSKDLLKFTNSNGWIIWFSPSIPKVFD
jgi:hypothetical protein